MPDLVLDVADLALAATVRRATFAPVTDAQVSVRAGEVVGLVGESGSGKSLTALTVLSLLPDQVSRTAGSVKVEDQEVAELDERGLARLRGAVAAIVFQDSLSSLNPTMTIGRQVEETVRVHRDCDRATARAAAIEALELVGFPQPHERYDSYPHQLSGGLRQRVAIAMAIALRPRLLIADEPTTALDVTIQAQILELLQRLARELDMGVLLITHDLGVIASVTDRVTVMYAGRTVESCTTLEAFASPQHPYTQALVLSAPTLTGPADVVLQGIPGVLPDPRRPEPGCPYAPRCTRALDRCVTEIPVLVRTDERSVACFNPVGSDD